MRVQLMAVIAVIFSIAGVAVYVQGSDLVTGQAVSNIDAQLLGARQSVVQRRTLREFAILSRASRVAAWPQLVALLQKTPADYAGEDGTVPTADTFNYKVHQAVYEEVLVWNERFNAFQRALFGVYQVGLEKCRPILSSSISRVQWSQMRPMPLDTGPIALNNTRASKIHSKWAERFAMYGGLVARP